MNFIYRLYYLIICLSFFHVAIIHSSVCAQLVQPKSQNLLSPKSAPPTFSQTMLQPEEVEIKTTSAVLMDSLTGRVLLDHHAHQQIPPASFVKLLSLYVVFDALQHQKIRLADEVHVSKKAWKTGGSRMFIEVNSKVPVEELIKGMAVVSGNDACVAIAEHLHGDVETFVRVMNNYARQLGMTNSFFVNPHGLPAAQQVTTAYDMAILARSYVNQFPEALRYHRMQSYAYNGIEQPNRNGLLKRDDSVDGLKTGWVVESGYNLVATAKRENHRLIAVVMGARTPAMREREAQKMLNYGFQNFTLLTLFEAGQVLAQLPVWKGAQNLLPVVAAQTATMLIARHDVNQVHRASELPNTVVAPVEKNQVLGQYVISLGDKQLRSVPLQASIGIEKAGALKALRDHLYMRGYTPTRSLTLIATGMVSLCAAVVLFAAGKKRRRRKKPRLYVP